MENKLSFRKRKMLVKKECFEEIQKIDMDKTSNKKVGYYSLKTIFSVLNPLLEKHDIDIDIDIGSDAVLVTWYDCNSESTATQTVNIEKLQSVGRLPQMPNEVQSYGAEISYYRRYALTNALGLNSTDQLENNNISNNNNNNSNRNNNNTNNSNKNTKTQNPPKINDTQRKQLYATIKEKNVSDQDLHVTITKLFQISSVNDLTVPMFNSLLVRIKNKKAS